MVPGRGQVVADELAHRFKVVQATDVRCELREGSSDDSEHHSGRSSGSEIVAIVSKVTITQAPRNKPLLDNELHCEAIPQMDYAE
jgi:hypothetical protein